MTIMIDDAGVGDLLFGAVVGAYRTETREFYYDVVETKYFQKPLFKHKQYLNEASRVVFKVLNKLNPKDEEPIYVCSGNIFDQARRDLKSKYSERVRISKISGLAQHYTETAYLDELRNLGYQPISDREKKRVKSFYHMLNWVRYDPNRIRYVKTGWPRLARYDMRSRKRKYRKPSHRIKKIFR